jgi:signal transduction histidine kinase
MDAVLSSSLLNALEKSDAFYYIRTDTQGCYTFANDAFLHKFSHIDDNFIGKFFGNTVYIDDVDKCNQAALFCMTHPGEVRRVSMRKPTQGGDFFWTDWEFSALTDDEGVARELHCIGYDVTTLVEKQKELLAYTDQLQTAIQQSQSQNDNLLKANSELDTFVYRVSHDLRAPISSALGLIELTLNEKDSNTKGHYLNLQQQSLRKLDKFIQDILDYSRNSRRDHEVEQIDLEALVRDTCETYAHNAPLTTLKINILQLKSLFTDKMRLSMILNNLISNAYKYANPRRENPWICIEGQVDKDMLKLSISDNGIGIDPVYLDKIFDMFYRATDLQVGSGLGLYIVKEAVHKLKGDISVQSRKGEGCAFFLELPNALSSQEKGN